jgi:hypothetical protein
MRRTILAVLVVAVLSQAAARAQTVHAIIVGNTLDDRIGPGVVQNVARLKDFFQSVRSTGGVSVTIHMIQDGQFGCKTIRDSIQQLKISHSDTVLFHYSGHGDKSATSRFPELDCQVGSDPLTLQLDDVMHMLKAKGPRLTLVIADACNKDKEVLIPPLGYNAPSFEELKGPGPMVGLRRLFLDYDGMMEMSASIPDQYAWYLVGAGPSAGGFFTTQLLKMITKNLMEKGKDASWEKILGDTAETFPVPTIEGLVQQTPQFTTDQFGAKKH